MQKMCLNETWKTRQSNANTWIYFLLHFSLPLCFFAFHQLIRLLIIWRCSPFHLPIARKSKMIESDKYVSTRYYAHKYPFLFATFIHTLSMQAYLPMLFPEINFTIFSAISRVTFISGLKMDKSSFTSSSYVSPLLLFFKSKIKAKHNRKWHIVHT